MTQLKIAQVVNIWQSIPPVGYGGTERVVYDICEGLVKKGHDVTLFATGDSTTSAKLDSPFAEKLLGKDITWNNYLYPLVHFLRSYEKIQKGRFDIVHGHYSVASDLISISLSQLLYIPSVFTLHTVLPIAQKQRDRKLLIEAADRVKYVSITNAQRVLPLSYAGTVYHGMNLGESGYIDNPSDDYMMWLGRIVPEKGLEYCFDLMERLGKKLIIAGRVDRESKTNFSYFQENIEKRLVNSNIFYIEEVDSSKRNELFSKSKVFLFPIEWEEPFGLVMIEAMATGTPVVAFARGSVPEVVKDGVTGFIVNSSENEVRGNWIVKKTGIEGLCEAVEKIYSMPKDEYQKMRMACRAHVEENFTVEKMVTGYEEVYRKVLSSKY